MFVNINLVYNVYMYMVLMTFLPFMLLAILNALIVAQQLKKIRGGGKDDDADGDEDKEGDDENTVDVQLALAAPGIDINAAVCLLQIM